MSFNPFSRPAASTSTNPYPDPHRVLVELFNHSHLQRGGRFSNSIKAAIVRQLYQSIWQGKQEWVDLFIPEGESEPSPDNPADWLDGDRAWSLAAVQKKAEEVKRQVGKATPPPRGRVCGKVFQRFERTYTCKTCSINSSVVLCVDCFKAADHEDHEVLFGQTYAFSASCDCGDTTAWKSDRHLGCAHHPPLPPGERDLDPSTQPSAEHARSQSYGSPPPANSPSGESIRAIQLTVSIVIEYIIQVLQHAFLPSEYSILPRDEEQMRTMDVPTGEPPERRGRGPWAVVIWQDEKHVLKELTRQVRDALDIKWELAEQWVRDADDIGRKVLLVSPNPIIAFHTANMIQQIESPVTLRLASDTFKEEVVGVLISWLRDMCDCSIGGDDMLFKRLLVPALLSPRQQSSGSTSGTPLAADLRDLDSGKMYVGTGVTRMDWLLQLDSRLWKKAKWEMRQIVSSVMMSNLDARKDLACRYAMNYPRLIEHYLFQDRELDTNIIYSSAFLVFTNGAVAAHATAWAQLFPTVLQVAQSWYTGQVINGERLVIPPVPFDSDPASPKARLDLDIPAFRGKKGLAILNHLRCMFRQHAIKVMLVKQPALFNRAVAFLNMFVGIQPQKRELGEHVEYEVDWLRSFVVLGDLAKMCREFGEAFQVATAEQLLASMSVVSNRILCDMMLLSTTLDPERYARPVEHDVVDVLVAGSKFTLIKQSVSRIEAFSFHHYMTLLFAEMLRATRVVLQSEDGLINGLNYKEILERFMFRASDPGDMERMKLMVLEYPMQKHVVMSQVRADMWKKNGAAMRMQYHHYRDMTVREATIDQEFFLLQAGLCFTDPFKFVVALIDRFGLSPWFRGNAKDNNIWLHHGTEPKQRIALLEDLLLLMIHLVSYPAHINGWSRDQITQAHIIHQLAVHPMSYSEVYKKLPERSQESSITPILLQVADFREPTETAPGQYSLKDEYCKQIDPYWHYYSRNDQRGAMDRLIAQAKKLDPSVDDPVIRPRALEIPAPAQPFANISAFLHTHVVADLVYWTLAHCMHMNEPDQWAAIVSSSMPAEYADSPTIPTWDLLLDYSLHLAMMALDVAPKPFAEASVDLKDDGAHSTFQNLWLMQNSAAFKSFRSRIDYILDTIVDNLPQSYTTEYRNHKEAEKMLEFNSPARPDPKAAAAARQKAIMAAFAKQQQNFAALMDEEDEDEDEAMESQHADEKVENFGQCILCQEEVTSKTPGGMLALLQPSRTLREAVQDRDWFEESLHAPASLDRATRYHRFSYDDANPEPTSTTGYTSTNYKFGIHMSACGHYMHETCMGNYFEATKVRHTQQVQRHHPENAVRLEYMCPLCKSLGNSLISVAPTTTPMKPPLSVTKDGEKPPSLSITIRRVSSEGLLRVADSQRIWDHHIETGEVVPWFSDCIFAVHSLDQAHRRSQMKSISRIADRMRGLVRPLSEQSQRIRGRKSHMYFPDDLVGYTIAVNEVALRGLPLTPTTTGPTPLTVAEQMNEISMRLVKKLIGLLQLELDLYFGPSFDRTALRVGIFARFLPDWYRSSTLPSPLLLRQPLGMVVEAAAIAPDLLHAVIVMAYYAELTRVMIGMSVFIKKSMASKSAPSPRTIPPDDPTLTDALSIFTGFKPVMQSVLRNAGSFTESDGVLSLVTDPMLAKLIYSHTLPFLRRCAIIYYAVAGTYPVVTPSVVSSFASETCEYSRLLSVLGIPRPKETLRDASATETPIVARWLTQWAVQGRHIPTLEYPGTYELTRLPRKWEDIVLAYADRKCNKCKTKPTYPAICLFCGEMVCLAGDCCSEGEQGECNIHMRECGAVVGMFVDIRRWVLLYLYAGSGSFGHMPYLDKHGELDVSMRRGHRQYMHVGRMDELRRATWLMHTIPHLTARKLELTSDGGGWGCL